MQKDCCIIYQTMDTWHGPLHIFSIEGTKWISRVRWVTRFFKGFRVRSF